LAKYNENYQAEKNGMNGACGPNGGEDESIQVIARKARRKQTTRKTMM
jgi:hypothetical protein